MRGISSGFVEVPDLSLCVLDSLSAVEFDRAKLLAHVLDGFTLRHKGAHGPSHWARVRLSALQVAKVRKADLLVVELFAFCTIVTYERKSGYLPWCEGRRVCPVPQSKVL